VIRCALAQPSKAIRNLGATEASRTLSVVLGRNSRTIRIISSGRSNKVVLHGGNAELLP